MKIKNITIGIQSLKKGLKQFTETVKSIHHGKSPRARHNDVYFTSVEAMRRILTPKRLELLHVIREKHPGSIYNLAQTTNRDLKNVQDDVTMLSRIGLISLSRTKTARNNVVPRVEYDSLQLHIPVI